MFTVSRQVTDMLSDLPLPPVPVVPHGGDWRGQRHFVASAVPTPIDEPEPTPEHAEDTASANGCDLLNSQCIEHERDYGGTVTHRGPLHTAAGAFGGHLLEHRLIQWAGDSKPVLAFVGDLDWPDLDLPDVDALIDAVEKQLAALRDSRAHLAAALGVAPPTQPPEQQKARPATGGAGEQVAE